MNNDKEEHMHVAMISYHTCPLATLGGKDTGGMNVYVRELTRQLGRMGVRVDVFTRSQDEHVPHVLHDLGYGNRIVHVRAGPEVPLKKEELYSYLPEFVDGIFHFIEHKKIYYDLIHSHYWMSGIAARDLKKAWNTPVIHMFHTLGIMKQRVARTNEETEGVYRLDGEREVLKFADKIIAATPAEVAQLQWLYQANIKKVVVIPPGVDTSHFYPIPKDEAKEYIGVPPCDNMLLYVGRIEPLKGIDTLIQAIALLHEKSKHKSLPFCLAVIGGTPETTTEKMSAEMTRLQSMCKENNLEDFILFLGQRNQDSLPYYYSAAEAVVVPSYYESFGMVALEAMACGTPVIVSQVGGLAFLVENGITGFTVPVEDSILMADCIEKILYNNELRDQLGKQAAQYAKQYSWDLIANEIVALYRKVLDNN